MSRRSNVVIKHGQEHRQEFVKLFRKFDHGGHSDWAVWQDFIYMAASALSQPCDFRQNREDEYLRIIGKYNKSEQELFPQMLAEVVMSLEQEKFADVLGDLYMQLELYNKWKGQFFSPFEICYMMSALTVGNLKDEIEESGYISVNDCCCGAGGMLIAFAKHCYEQGVNFQNHVLFVAQDVDPVVARMCYIQCSLLGMSGYVIVGNTLLPPEKMNSYDYWYTPMYFSGIWHWRKVWKQMDGLFGKVEGEVVVEVKSERKGIVLSVGGG